MYKILENKLQKIYQNSLIIIDKKAGITSHDEVYNLRRIFNIKKIGHSGTLDPKVTGLLVMGIGKGTKILEYMLLSEKRYLAEFIFHKEIQRNDFEKTLKKFIGKIIQLPPVKSAVKREEREREVYKIDILDYDKNNRWVKLMTAVEKGTYIRKLAHDMGERIGVKIHMGDLRRIRVGPFSEDNSNYLTSELLSKKMNKFKSTKCFLKKVYLYFNLKKYFYSIDELFKREEKAFQKIKIKKEALKYVLAGNPIRNKNLLNKKLIKKNELYSIWFKNDVLGIGEIISKNFQERDGEVEVIKVKKLLK